MEMKMTPRTDPPRKLRLSFEEMCALVTEENRHDEIDSGPPVGREFTGDAWEECRPGYDADPEPPSTPR
jgi:hypothetical protein